MSEERTSTDGVHKGNADLAHLVERNLAKVEVAGSSPVIRLKHHNGGAFFFFKYVLIDNLVRNLAILQSLCYTKLCPVYTIDRCG